MFSETSMLFFYCETPLHAGAGASVSYVDLPIQREKHTDHPTVQSGGVKGAIRDWARDLYGKDNKELLLVFGPEPGKDTTSDFGGSLSFTDAQILLFPVRSFSGGFAWVTCPLVMNRLSRFLAMMKIKAGLEEMAPGDDSIIVSDKSILKVGYPRNERVILEDFAFKLDQRKEMSQNVKSLAIWINKYAIPKKGPFKYTNENLENRLAILSNTRFKDFVHLSTEIITRIRIGDTGTVETGALWTQELLPSDSLLYSLALAKDIQYPEGNDLQKYSATQSIKFLHGLVEKSHILQMGGDETVGRGLVNICYMKGKSKKMELHPRRFQNHD